MIAFFVAAITSLSDQSALLILSLKADLSMTMMQLVATEARIIAIVSAATGIRLGQNQADIKRHAAHVFPNQGFTSSRRSSQQVYLTPWPRTGRLQANTSHSLPLPSNIPFLASSDIIDG